MSRKPLSLPQIVILALLWITICYIILTGSDVRSDDARAEDVYRENQQGQTSWQKRDKN